MPDLIDPATLARNIRSSLATIYSLSDEELCARDAHMIALCNDLALESVLTPAGEAAYAALTQLVFGASLSLPTL